MKTYFWIVKLKTRKSVRSSEDIFLTKKEAKESIAHILDKEDWEVVRVEVNY